MFDIYVDSDSLPKYHRGVILRRTAASTCVGRCVFAADRALPDVLTAMEEHTASLRAPLREKLDKQDLRRIRTNISMVVVESGADSADNALVELAVPPAIAVTHDIPLASRLVEKGVIVMDDRGGIYTRENMAQRLSERNFMTRLREDGYESEKTKNFTDRDRKAFSDAFDTLFSRFSREF